MLECNEVEAGHVLRAFIVICFPSHGNVIKRSYQWVTPLQEFIVSFFSFVISIFES